MILMGSAGTMWLTVKVVNDIPKRTRIRKANLLKIKRNMNSLDSIILWISYSQVQTPMSGLKLHVVADLLIII